MKTVRANGSGEFAGDCFGQGAIGAYNVAAGDHKTTCRRTSWAVWPDRDSWPYRMVYWPRCPAGSNGRHVKDCIVAAEGRMGQFGPYQGHNVGSSRPNTDGRSSARLAASYRIARPHVCMRSEPAWNRQAAGSDGDARPSKAVAGRSPVSCAETSISKPRGVDVREGRTTWLWHGLAAIYKRRIRASAIR